MGSKLANEANLLSVPFGGIVGTSGNFSSNATDMLRSPYRFFSLLRSLHGASACLRAILDVHGLSLFASEMVTRWTDEKTVAPEDSPSSGLLDEGGDVEIICIMIFLSDCYRSSSRSISKKSHEHL